MNKLIGKYFRLLCIVAFPIYVLYVTWIIFFMPHRLSLNMFMVVVWIILVLICILEIGYLHWSYKERREVEYETWSSISYIFVAGVLIYLSLELISSWIGFDLIEYLKNSLGF